MSISPQSHNPHSVLQLHGGGTIILAGIIKCALIEELTQRRIHDVFPSIIADSGGAMTALCLSQMPAKDLLDLYLRTVSQSLPSGGFYVRQSIPRLGRLFNTSSLRATIESILGDKPLTDYAGNIFIGVHHIQNGAQRIGKMTNFDGQTHFVTEGADRMKMADIAMAASAIPGVMPALQDQYIDPISNQNPAVVLARIQRELPDTPIQYLQLGNIVSGQIIHTIQQPQFVGHAIRGRAHRYMVHHRHSAHLRDAADVLKDDNVRSMEIYCDKLFSSINNSAEQRTAISRAILESCEERRDEFAQIIAKFSGCDANEVKARWDAAIASIKDVLDPHMVKEKIVSSKATADTEQSFPHPQIIPLESTFSYQLGYILGFHLSKEIQRLRPHFIKAMGSWERKLLPPRSAPSTHSPSPTDNSPH